MDLEAVPAKAHPVGVHLAFVPLVLPALVANVALREPPSRVQLLPPNPRLWELLLDSRASGLVGVEDTGGQEVLVSHAVYVGDDSAWVTNQHNPLPMPEEC